MNPRATFDLAIRFNNGGAPIGEVFSFLSGLYFRGKLAYANCFAGSIPSCGSVYIITSNRGLVPPDTIITPLDLRTFRRTPIDPKERLYVEPLRETAVKLLPLLPDHSQVVLLGSVGTMKYAGPLLEIFGQRLRFPESFVGRGDMSRGGLMLRSIDTMQELQYVPLHGAVHGKRPPKLRPRIVPSSTR